MRFDGLAGLKYFIQIKMNDCIEAVNASEKIDESFFRGKFNAYKDVADLIEAFEKANEEVAFEEEDE